MSTVSKSFTAVGVSAELTLKPGQSATYSVSGTFDGTVLLQDLAQGFANVLATATSAASGTILNETKGDKRLRFQCTARASGTIVTSIADANDTITEIKNPATGDVMLRFTDDGLEIPGALSVTGTVTVPAIAAGDASLGTTGIAAAQGGAIVNTGGTSSTSANAGGAVSNVGGTPGATGVGGAVVNTGGIGGATSGAGGAVTNTGGAGTAGNAAGGAVSNVGGGGQGSAAGGASSVTGGVGGATGVGGAASVVGGAGGATSGKGGAANVTGGAGTAGNASGGSVIAQPGAKNGSGLDGGVFNRGTFQFWKQPAPQTATATATLTVAQMTGGILAATPAAAVNYTLPTGTDMKAALPTDLAADDSFELSIINLGGTTNFDITLLVGTDFTIVGSAVVRPGVDSETEHAGQAVFRVRFVSGVTFIAYRIA